LAAVIVPLPLVAGVSLVAKLVAVAALDVFVGGVV